MIDINNLLISDHIYKHNQSLLPQSLNLRSNLFWILGIFYGSVSFSLNGSNQRFRLFSYLCDFSVYIHKIRLRILFGTEIFPFQHAKLTTASVAMGHKPNFTPQVNPMFPFRISFNSNLLKINNVFLWSYFQEQKTSINNGLVQVIPVKLINLFYNINPSFLNYLNFIDYSNLFHTYWLTGFLETNLTYLSFNFNNLTLPLHNYTSNHLSAEPGNFTSALRKHNLRNPMVTEDYPYEDKFVKSDGSSILPLCFKNSFSQNENAKLLPNPLLSSVKFTSKLNKYPSLNWNLNLNTSPKLTYIKFEFHLYDNNLYNLLLLNKLLKGKILLINHTYKLILKYNFGEKEIKQIIEYLDNYSFLSSKHFMYLKLRIIYRRCQRKANYYHKGILQILKIISP